MGFLGHGEGNVLSTTETTPLKSTPLTGDELVDTVTADVGDAGTTGEDPPECVSSVTKIRCAFAIAKGEVSAYTHIGTSKQELTG